VILAGTVTADREAIVRLRLRGANGLETDIDAVVDTGFTESLTLPTSWMSALALPQIRSEELVLADGSRIQVAVHEVMLLWDGQQRSIFAHCLEGTPLIGMSLLWDHLLNIEAKDGGPMSIRPIP
jgi:clan AA aspartic protease